MKTIKFLLAILVSFAIVACGGGGGGGSPAPAVTLSSIAITPASATVAKGATASLTATGTFSNGFTSDITSQVTWTSATPATASTGSTGIVTGNAVGTTTVTAALSGITSPAANITVTPATLTSITLSPLNPTVPRGATQQFTATGLFTDGSVAALTTGTTWSSATTANATIDAAGLATTPNTSTIGGTSTISVTSGAITSTTILTVGAANFASVAVTPISSTITAGLTANLSATATYTDATTTNVTNTATWSSANTGIATVSAAGVVTGVATGSTTITASMGGVPSPAATITVTAATLTGISIAPTTPSVAKGLTQQFTATGTFNNGTSGDVSGSVTWNSSVPTIATLNAIGLASTLAQGTTNITATSGVLTSNTASLTVTAPVLVSIAVTPANATLMTRQTQQYAATGTYSDTTTANLTASSTWTSSNSGAVTVGASTGLATVAYAGVGATTIGATSGGIVGSTALSTVLQQTWSSGSNTVNALSVYGNRGVASATNVPGARWGSISWIDAAGSLWLFGGGGYNNIGQGLLNDLWKWDGANWTWVSGSANLNTQGFYGTLGTGSTANLPGTRTNSISWADTAGNLWLFGGVGMDSLGNNGDMNDLWKYNIAAKTWTWVGGSSTWNAAGVYGTQGIAATINIPGARENSISWADAAGNLWLFGGRFPGPAFGNDLWKYNLAGNTWTWVSGSSTTNAIGVYGTKGVAAPGNVPGARERSISWIDGAGNLWLFGGFGLDSSTYGDLNDLWKFDVVSGQWTWVSGSNTRNATGVYGTQGIAAAVNVPGAREGSISWRDATTGSLWLYGGIAAGGTTILHDLWKWDGANWTWVSGGSSAPGVYGTIGMGAATNLVGARWSSIPWKDTAGNLWLFGGNGFGSTITQGLLNDLWKLSP